MFNSSILLKALPSFWRDRFEDKSLLRSMYSYIGGYLADTYGSMHRSLASTALASTPLEEPITWNLIPLSSIHRVFLPSEGEEGTSLVVYGILEQEHLLTSCQRIYSAPTLSDTYLSIQKDYILLDVDSPELEDLIQLFDNTAFFSRFTKYLVFFNVDPITHFRSVEPDAPRVFYPLAFRVRSSLLSSLEEDVITQADITITIGSHSVRTNVIAMEQEENHTLLAIDPDAYTPFSEDAIATIEGLSEDPISVRVLSNYSLNVIDINVWAFDCSIDKLELFRRWGYLIGPSYLDNTPVKSSDRYHSILEEVLAARLRGLSSARLENIASLFGGSSTIEFNKLNDSLLTIDLVESKIITQLTEYTLLPGAVINLRVIKNCRAVVTPSGVVSLAGTFVVELASYTTYLLALQYYTLGEPLDIPIELASGGVIGRLLLPSTNSSLIVTLDSEQGIPDDGFYIRYLPGEVLFVPGAEYHHYSLERDEDITIGTIINPLAKVSDISSGLDDRVTSGMFLPEDMWEVDQASRREVSLRLTPFYIGAMVDHRVGDYELFIPRQDGTGDNFDRVTSSNPSGSAWSTAYKLYSHFLRSKVAVLESINNIGPYSNLDSVIRLVGDIRDMAKRILPLNTLPLIDFVPSPTSSLEVVVTRPETNIVIDTQRYEGINGLGFTLLLRAQHLGNSTARPDLTHIIVSENNLYSLYAARLIGKRQDIILVELLEGALSVYTAIQENGVIGFKASGINYSSNITLLLTTNHVGSTSRLMVVGGSYPEYTSYYDYDTVTVSEWLQAEEE